MNYKSRLGLGAPMGGGGFMAGMPSSPSVSANLGASYNVGGSATGPALVLIALTVGLVIHYIWTRGQQGGR